MAAKVAPSTSALPGTSSSAFQMIGQNAVFDRPEQRRDAAEAEQRAIEQVERREPEARRRDELDEDLGELQPLRDRRLVMGVGDLAADRRQRDRRQDEDRDGQRDLGAGVLRAEAEQDEHRQHLANEIVVEGGKKLAPEQRREAPRAHQLAEHTGRRRSEVHTGRMGTKTPSASSERPGDLPPQSIGHVANADADVLRHVGQLDRRAGLGGDQQRARSGVEIAIAEVERRAGRESGSPGRPSAPRPWCNGSR